YDERLKGWISKHLDGVTIGTYNIGPKSMFDQQNTTYISHYDDGTKTFTFLNQDLDLAELFQEIEKIKDLADSWVKAMEQSKTTPPLASAIGLLPYRRGL